MADGDAVRLRVARTRTEDGRREGERARLDALSRYDILDTPAERGFDDLVQLARQICAAPVALVSLVDRDRVWFKARAGLARPDMPRAGAFCASAIEFPGRLMRVRDAAAEARFARNPLVAGEPGLRSYLGAPIVGRDGYALGTLCVLDARVRDFTDLQEASLRALARQAQSLLELRLGHRELAQARRAHKAAARELATFQREMVSANVRLLREARQDTLSGLPNRRALEDLRERFGNGEFDACERFAMVVLDIDRFKRINDGHGHAVGDQVIRQLGQAIRDCVRGQDLAGRYGGEEFAVFLPGADLDGARRMAERLRERIAAIVQPCAFTVSIGVAAGCPRSDSLEAVMDAADQALYRAKREGRDRIVAAD